MVAIDYVVVTWPEISTVQAHHVTLSRLVRSPERQQRSGYIGVSGLQSFFGYNSYWHRYMFIATGAYADECARQIPYELDVYASFARIDVQATFRIYGADNFISNLKKSNRYKGTRIVNDDGAGMTFYIGSRSSNLFCRAYNKSFEANLPPDEDGELVRVEFVLRDDYADKVWRRFREGALDEAFSALAKRMFEEESARRIVERAQVPLSARDLDLLRQDSDDWRERRLRWLENTVIPALNKLVTESPNLAERVWRTLDNLPKPGDNRK